MSDQKRRWGDRRDGYRIRGIDAMHYIIPRIFPNRTDNEAYISERIDLTNINKWLAEKNIDNPDYKYRLFNTLVAALLKTVILRPKMNRFLKRGDMYQRNYISASFVVKKQFTDDAEEGLAVIYADDSDTMDSIHDKIRAIVQEVKSDKLDESSDAMETINRLPRFLKNFIIWIVRKLDDRGLVPKSLIATDPYYATVLLSNLGSIKLKSGYHHLANWGTNSVFVVVGEKKMTPFFNPDGTFELRETVDIGMTVDERIADGYYYSKTVRLLKRLLENPELLDQPFGTEVEY